MGVLVNMLQIYMPDFVKKIALTQLFNSTAVAFEAEVPPLAGLDSEECLAQYARFAQTQAEQRLRDGREVEAAAQRLYRNAVEMGRLHNKWLRPGTVQDVMDIGRVLYRILDIDLQGDARGEVVISRCYFSRFYSAEVCRLMSAMDRGLFAGLSNGGELTFSSRITEGQPCCRGHFSWPQKSANYPAKKFNRRVTASEERTDLKTGPPLDSTAGGLRMKHAIVIGSGAGGATVAKELQGKFDVTVLDTGKEFRPFPLELATIERVKKTGLLLDERVMSLSFPTLQIRKTPDMVLVKGIGLGGTTTISTGNAVRMDRDLKAIGINLDDEFEEVFREIPITTAHQKRWHKHTRRLFEICCELGLDPQPMPKMGNYEKCISCGRCVFGCRNGAKWDSRQFLQIACDRGAQVMTNCWVERIVIENGHATGVEARHGWTRRFYPADLVVLAAGGFGTPVILQNSGIPCEPRLFVDPVLCLATRWENALQCKEIEMPFLVQRDHYILSPYFDYVSFLFNKAWRYPAKDTLGIMIKLADSTTGSISKQELRKTLTALDKERLSGAVETGKEILRHFGAKDQDIFLGTLNAGHPGGMLPLTEREAESFHHDRLPENLYVADATLIPESLGNPPILTIVAMAKRISKICQS